MYKILVVIAVGSICSVSSFPVDEHGGNAASVKTVASPNLALTSANAVSNDQHASAVKASSRVGAQGETKSSAMAANLDEQKMNQGLGADAEHQHQNIPQGAENHGPMSKPEVKGSEGVEGDLHHSHENVPVGEPQHNDELMSGQNGQPGMGGEGSKPKANIQKVNAVANMETGTAVASAVSKRDTLQQVSAAGNVAVGKAKVTHMDLGSTVQDVNSHGGKLAVATAETGGFSLRDSESKTLSKQTVSAEGNKSIASAANHEDSDLNLQNVSSKGGELAVATATVGGNGGSEPNMPPAELLAKGQPSVPHS